MSETFKNIITLGGHNKIKVEEEELRTVLRNLNEVNKIHGERKNELNEQINEVVELKIIAINKVKKIKKISSLISVKDRQIIEKELKDKDYSLEHIEHNITISESLIDLGKSSFKGVAISGLAAGSAWTTVASLGAASTGTAISSLSGVAATNATLAWFGGGSIASGGIGMAGGTVVIGGLVVVPALIIAGLIQYKISLNKVKDIKVRKNEALKCISDLEQNLNEFTFIEKRIIEYKISLNKSVEVFQHTYKKTYGKIYRLGSISIFFKKIRKKLFNIPFFNQREIKEISFLGKCTSDIMKIIDTKIL